MSATPTGFEVIRDQKVLIIKFNNVKKKNALSNTIYGNLAKAVQAAAQDDSIRVIVLTGTGDYYTSGNDLTQSLDPKNLQNAEKYFETANDNLMKMLRAFIDCNKLLIALVNGPCIGIGATLSVLCDIVWCSETAYFYTPFTKLGLVPEGCSSYLFPLILGRSKANEMLLLSEKLSAEEAMKFNFVSRIYKPHELHTTIWPKIHEFSNLPPESMLASKQLIRNLSRPFELKALSSEIRVLRDRLQSMEFMEAVIEFVNRKNKSKL